MLVIDACGVGALPDAADYGDEGTNTLAHLAEAVGGLELPTLAALGLGSIIPLRGVPAAQSPVIHGRLHPLGPGKDSVTGHWELMGVVVEHAPPTYPHGFPPQLIARLEAAMGRRVICNRPYNGIAAIERVRLRAPAHGCADPLHLPGFGAAARGACRAGRPGGALPRLFGGARGPVRPRRGRSGDRAAVHGRGRRLRAHAGAARLRRFPPTRSYLQEIQDAGVQVHAIGKIADLFAGVGITRSHPGATNALALESVEQLLEELECGLVFVNLIETDQVYGHRKDIHGFDHALREIDSTSGGAWRACAPTICSS